MSDRDDLRTRIAYALAQADGDLPGMEPDSWDYVLAEAVIAALGLREETGYGTTFPNVPVEDRRLIRYVTEWEPAE